MIDTNLLQQNTQEKYCVANMITSWMYVIGLRLMFSCFDHSKENQKTHECQQKNNKNEAIFCSCLPVIYERFKNW